MFTGIIQATAQLLSVTDKDCLKEIVIPLPPALLIGLVPGASVSVQGICLTATAIQNNTVHFDVAHETLQRTTLNALREGATVNIERSLKIGDEIGGHLLSGHIMGIAIISHLADLPFEQRTITLTCDPTLMKYIFLKDISP